MKSFIFCIIMFLFGHLHASEIVILSQAVIPSAIAQANPGDTLVLVNGTYTNVLIQFNTNGTEDNPIVLKAETAGEVIITGQSKLVIQGSHLIVDGFKFEDVLWPTTNKNRIVDFYTAEHCRLTNCAFYRCGSVDGKYVHIILLLEGSKNNRVDHNYLEDNYGQGIGIYVLSSGINSTNTDNRIDHNHIYGITPDGASNGQEPIQIGQDQTTTGLTAVRAIVEFNLIENQHSDADPEMISNKSAENIYRYNTFRNNTGLTREVSLRGGSNCIVEGNFCLNVSIRVYGPDHTIINNYIFNPVGVVKEGIHIPGGTGQGVDGVNYPETQNVLIANNTIIDAATFGISIGTQNPNWVHDITLKNNIVSCGSGTLYYEDAAVGSSNVYTTNIAYATNGATAHSSNIPNSGIIQTNPNLVLNGETFHLLDASSPAVDSAVVVSEVNLDFDGQNREPLPDIGCDEFSNEPILYYPFNIGDVGPCWTNGGNCTVLPIELIEFNGIVDDKAIVLSWITTLESENQGFEIDHSTDALVWNSIGFLENQEANNSAFHYTFIHTTPSEKINYYRLKQINIDNTYNYSKIISITFYTMPHLQLFPNPTTGIIQISDTRESMFNMTLIDIFGRIIKQKRIQDPQIDISYLPDGYYIIRLESASLSKLFFIQKRF